MPLKEVLIFQLPHDAPLYNFPIGNKKKLVWYPPQKEVFIDKILKQFNAKIDLQALLSFLSEKFTEILCFLVDTAAISPNSPTLSEFPPFHSTWKFGCITFFSLKNCRLVRFCLAIEQGSNSRDINDLSFMENYNLDFLWCKISMKKDESIAL